MNYYNKHIEYLKNFYNKLKQNKLFRDSFWAIWGNFLGKGLSLLAGIFIAKLLGRDVFGEFSIIKNTVLSFSIMSTFGLGYSTTKFIAENKLEKFHLIPGIILKSKIITLIFSSLIGLIILFNSPAIALNILNASHLMNALRLVSIWIILNAFTTTQIGILSGLGLFKNLAKINTLTGIFLFLTSLTFSYYFSLTGAISALIISQAFNLLLNEILIQRFLRNKFKGNYDKRVSLENIKLLIYSLPITIQEFIYTFSGWLSSIIVINYSTYGQLGLYNAAMQISSIILYVPGILRNVMLSHFSENSNNPIYQRLILKRIIIINLFITTIPIIITIVFSSKIASFYGSTYSTLNSLLIVASIGTIFSVLGNIYTQLLLSLNKNWQIFFFRFYRDFFALISFFFLIKLDLKMEPSILLIINNLFFQATFVIIIIFYLKKIKNAF